MIIELLRFITIVDQGSLTKASENLFLTQPALSQSIERLEKELNVRLFRQIGKRLVITEEGEAVYQLGQQILKLWKNAKDLSNQKIRRKQRIIIGLYDNAALKLSKFFQKHLKSNQFAFEITIDRSSILFKNLLHGIYDICICIVPKNTVIPKNITLVESFSEQLIPVSGKKLIGNVSQVPFILYNKDSETRQYSDAIFLKEGIAPNIVAESTSPDFMKELAIGGVGIALLPENFVKRELQSKKLFIQKLPFSFTREIGVFLNKESNVGEDQITKKLIQSL